MIHRVYVQNTRLQGFRKLGFVQGLFFVALLLLLFLSVVFPNSFREISLVMMLLAFAGSFYFVSIKCLDPIYWMFFAASSIVTILYVLIGVINDAPSAALYMVPFVYVVTPLIWTFVLAAILSVRTVEYVIKLLIWMTVASGLTVAAFFYLFENYGKEAVGFFINTDNANVNLTDGNAGATMHVYGSLIFLSAAFFAAPSVVKNVFLRFLLFFIITIVAVTSGRSALMLSVLIGLFVGLFVGESSFKKKSINMLYYFMALIFLLLLLPVVLGLYQIDLFNIINNMFDEVSSGGGEERIGQADALLEGAYSTYFFGSGHGVGVDFLRSEDHPWRYELVWFATLHRVGIFGSIIYLAPFVFYLFSTVRVLSFRGLTKSEGYFFAGFLAAFVSSNTNPYIEAYPFQWMYILPLVAYFMVFRHSASSRVL